MKEDTQYMSNKQGATQNTYYNFRWSPKQPGPSSCYLMEIQLTLASLLRLPWNWTGLNSFKWRSFFAGSSEDVEINALTNWYWFYWFCISKLELNQSECNYRSQVHGRTSSFYCLVVISLRTLELAFTRLRKTLRQITRAKAYTSLTETASDSGDLTLPA